jgi:hypothetical protein
VHTLALKGEYSRDIVRKVRVQAIRSEWVDADVGYGKESALLHALEDVNEVFVAHVRERQCVSAARP